MDVPPKKSRSGRVFSPYEPWGLAQPSADAGANPAWQGSVDSGEDSEDDEPLTVLVARLKLETLLKPAVHDELQRAEDGAGDCEGADLSPPPSPLPSPLPSPATTPPSSAENSPALVPLSDLDESIPSLMLPPSSSAKSLPGLGPSPAAPPALTFVPSPHLTQPPGPTLPQPARQSPSTLTQRQKDGKKARQAKKRAQGLDPLVGKVRSSLSRKWMKPHAIRVNWSVRLLPAAKGGFVGIQYHVHDRSKPWTLEELRDLKFRIIEWDGCTPYAIVDEKNHIIAMLCGRPKDGNWDRVVEEMTRVLLGAGEQANLKPEDLSHRRGHYPALSTGVSYGGGQTIPGNLRNSPANQKVIDSLRANWAMKRVAGFGSSQFAYYFPKNYHYYSKNLRKLFCRYPHLRHNFMNSIFPACTFNMGRNTVALEHADTGNLASGGCPVTSGGNYNPKLGGHIVLFPLRIAVEFPPGSTIIIPSSTVPHGNTPIQPNETRVSFTQYCAGGLHRWVEYGYQSMKSCALKNKKLKDKLDALAGSRWLEALNRFSKLDELHQDRIKVFKLK